MLRKPSVALLAFLLCSVASAQTAVCADSSLGGACLAPSGVFRLSLNQVEPGNWATRIAFGMKLEATTTLGSYDLKLAPALWVDDTLQVGLLEAYAQANWGEVSIVLGKRTNLSGPWDDTLLGRSGQWGLFARYAPFAAPWLGAEAAYLPRPGLAGGQGFVGVQAGPFRLGSFLEVAGGKPVLYPRAGLELGQGSLNWQLDRGFWADLRFTLPLGQVLADKLQCAPGGDGFCWARGEPQVESLVRALDTAHLGLLLWWNPDWALLGSTDPGTGEKVSLPDWLGQPKKLFLGLEGGVGPTRLGLDLSLAPVRGYRVYLELRLP